MIDGLPDFRLGVPFQAELSVSTTVSSFSPVMLLGIAVIERTPGTLTEDRPEGSVVTRDGRVRQGY